MTYIAIQEDGNYIEDAENAVQFLKKVVKYCTSAGTKVFDILADSGKMTINELVEFANNDLLTDDDAIASIYELGKQIV